MAEAGILLPAPLGRARRVGQGLLPAQLIMQGHTDSYQLRDLTGPSYSPEVLLQPSTPEETAQAGWGRLMTLTTPISHWEKGSVPVLPPPPLPRCRGRRQREQASLSLPPLAVTSLQFTCFHSNTCHSHTST